MRTVVSWLAVGVVALLVCFVLKKMLSLVRGRKQKKEPFHDSLVDVAEDIAAASRIAAALSGAAAFFAAPAGLLAVAAAFGLASKPLIVILLPLLLSFAIGASAMSAAAKLYAKSKRKNK